MQTTMRTIMAAALTACVVGYSVPGLGEITASRTIPPSVQVGQSATVTFELELDETELDPINAFYYADHIPSGLSVTTVSVEVDGSVLDESEYTYEIGGIGSVYPDCRPHRWIIETPPSYAENNPVEDRVVIVYQVQSAVSGSYTFPNYDWVGNIVDGAGSVFGYDDDSASLYVGALPPELNGVPQFTLVGTVTLVSLLILVAVFRQRVYVRRNDVS